MDLSEVKCIFCSIQVSFHVQELMTHLQDDHKLVGRQTIFMALIIVDSEADHVLSDLLAKVDDRVKVLLEKHVERGSDDLARESLEETDSAGSEENISIFRFLFLTKMVSRLDNWCLGTLVVISPALNIFPSSQWN